MNLIHEIIVGKEEFFIRERNKTRKRRRKELTTGKKVQAEDQL